MLAGVLEGDLAGIAERLELLDQVVLELDVSQAGSLEGADACAGRLQGPCMRSSPVLILRAKGVVPE